MEYREALTSRKYKEVHEIALKHAYEEVNITTVPTIIIGNTTITGMRSKETFEQIIKDELDKQRPDILMEDMSSGIDGCLLI